MNNAAIESPRGRMTPAANLTYGLSFLRKNVTPVKTGAGIQVSPMLAKQPTVYILASHRNGTLYTGVTSNLPARIWQHKNDMVEGFTKKYGVHTLVYYEVHEDMQSAINREKQIKRWKRAWKLALIEKQNPTWRDLSDALV